MFARARDRRLLYISSNLKITPCREHLQRCHSHDSTHKTSKAVVPVFTHQQIKALFERLKVEVYISVEDKWYEIVDTVRSLEGGIPVDRSKIQGPYNPDSEEIKREVVEASAQLDQVSRRDYEKELRLLSPEQYIAVCQTWVRQGKRYIEPSPVLSTAWQTSPSQSDFNSVTYPPPTELQNVSDDSHIVRLLTLTRSHPAPLKNNNNPREVGLRGQQ